MKPKYLFTIISICICAVLSAGGLGYYIMIPGAVGWLFLGGVVIHFGLIVLAGLLLALPFARFCEREGFWYLFTGICNGWVGVLSFALYFGRHVNWGMPETYLINFILGIIMLTDGLAMPRKPWERVER